MLTCSRFLLFSKSKSRKAYNKEKGVKTKHKNENEAKFKQEAPGLKNDISKFEVANPFTQDSPVAPTLQLRGDGTIYLSWIETSETDGSSLYFSELKGNSWTEATIIANGNDIDNLKKVTG